MTLGRDWIVKRATSGGSWKGKSWKAEVEWRTDLLEAGSEGKFFITPPIHSQLHIYTSRCQPWYRARWPCSRINCAQVTLIHERLDYRGLPRNPFTSAGTLSISHVSYPYPRMCITPELLLFVYLYIFVF